MVTKNNKRLYLVIISLIISFITFRISLYISPNSNLNIGHYNIHHLFVGILLIILGGIPLVIFNGNNRWLSFAAVCFGVGIGTTLDEWVYLIATNGSDAAYLLPISFWGAVIMILLTIIYAIII